MVGADVERTWVNIPGGRAEAFLLRSLSPSRGRGPLIIYAHGNGELVDYWLRQFAELQNEGISVLLVEYPGYGRSTGVPSETSIQQALAAGYDWAVSQPQVDPKRVVGYGRSLGGGAVCTLARVRALAALVLESTFTDGMLPNPRLQRPAAAGGAYTPVPAVLVSDAAAAEPAGRWAADSDGS